MGFFRDLKKLNDKSKEFAAQQPSAKDRMAQGTASMAAMNEMMAKMNAAFDPAQPSTTVDAQVIAVRDAGSQFNLQPVLDVDLLVIGTAGSPYPITVRQPIPHAAIARITVGATVPVRVRVDDPQAVFLIV